MAFYHLYNRNKGRENIFADIVKIGSLFFIIQLPEVVYRFREL